MQTLAITPAAFRRRVLDPDDPLCPFRGLGVCPDAVSAALCSLAPAFDAVVDIGLGLGRWYAPVWVCNRQCPARLLMVGRSREVRAAFARACGAVMSVD